MSEHRISIKSTKDLIILAHQQKLLLSSQEMNEWPTYLYCLYLSCDEKLKTDNPFFIPQWGTLNVAALLIEIIEEDKDVQIEKINKCVAYLYNKELEKIKGIAPGIIIM